METANKGIEAIDSELEDEAAALPVYDILTYPADFTLEVLVDKWKRREILVPDLQRRYVWNQAKASKLIESFLMGLPVPPIYTYQRREDNKLLVIDGQQRLLSIVYFFSGSFGDRSSKTKSSTFSLTGLNERSPYIGMTFDQMKEEDPANFNKLSNAVLRAFVMKQISPNDDTSIFQVFERLNNGGITLSGQEIRNCIYSGPFNDMLIRLNKRPAWRLLYGQTKEDLRMKDIEMILRFFALYKKKADYEKPMKTFLNTFMEKNKDVSGETILDLENVFDRAVLATSVLLGQKPFHIHRGLNVAVFDSVFTAIAMNLNGIDNVTAQDLKMRYATLKNDAEYRKWVERATTDDDVVPKRIDRACHTLFPRGK